MSAENEVRLDLSGNLLSMLDTAIQKVQQLKAEAQDAVKALNNGQGNPGDVRSAISAAAGAQSAVIGLSNSASSTPSGGSTSASQSASLSIQQLAAQAPRGSMMSAAASFPASVQAQILSALGVGTAVPAPAATTNVNHTAAQVALSQSAMAYTMYANPAGPPIPYGNAANPINMLPMYGSPAGPAAPNWFQRSFPSFAGMAGGRAAGFSGWLQGGGFGAAFSRATVGYYGLSSAADALNLYAQNTASGEMSPMSAAQLYGGISGAGTFGLIGGMLTPTAPGVGMMAGMMAGQQFGSALAATQMAQFVNVRNMATSLASVSARMGVSAYDLINAPRGYYGSGIGGGSRQTSPAGPGLLMYAEQISAEGKSARELALIATGLYTGTDIISGQQLARTYATTASALMAAGDDPAFALNPSLNLARKYGINAPTMANVAAPVLAARNRMGGNAVDLFFSHGPESFGAYADMWGVPDVGSVGLRAFRGYQRSQYALDRADLVARGSGQARSAAYQEMMDSISGLPGGTGSRTYLEARAGYRDATMQAFEQSSLVNYATPRAILQSQMDMARVLPFAPGRQFGYQAMGIRADLGQANRLVAFARQRRASGDLSEEEEYHLMSQAAQLRSGAAMSIANLAEGGPNLISGLAATGMFGAGLHRFSSMEQSAFFLNAAGSPRRAYGAINGRQARMQSDFYSSFDIPTGPYSRSAGVNNGMGGGGAESLLAQILRELQQLNGRGAGSFPRMDRNPRDIPPGGYGSGGKFN